MVIRATSLRDVARKFPEVSALLAARARSNTLRQAKIDALARPLAALIEEYNAANEQLDSLLDAAQRVRLGRQVAALEGSIKQTETELNSLR